MAGKNEYILWSRLFVAVPELVLEDAVMTYLRQRGLIDDDLMRDIKAAREALRKGKMKLQKLKGKTLLQRLLIMTPELLNRNTINIFEKLNLISKKDAGLMRLFLRSSGLLRGGKPASLTVMMQRMRRVFGMGFADDALRLAVDMGLVTRKDADLARATMLIGKQSREAFAAIQAAKTWHDLFIAFGSGVVDKNTIRALRLAGLLDNRTADALLETLSYARSQWMNFDFSRRADGLAARMAYTVSGVFNSEFMDVLAALQKMKKSELERIGLGWIHGKITPEAFTLLRIASQIATTYNRGLMEQMTERRYRVRSNEPPIVTYFRAAKATDDDILKRLAQAAADARKRATALAGAARGAEYTLRAAQLHQAMRQIWEGVGFLTIFGEKETAQAAVEASFDLQKNIYKNFPASVEMMLKMQAMSGIDSFISRRENTLQLSKRVYGNLNIFTNRVDKQIEIGLLQGQSAAEIGKRVESLINPKVMGGVKYAAMRLARTELSNAFHFTTIRHTREMPWVQGYKWNLSDSHKIPDDCNRYAQEQHHDKFPAGVFKKTDVPGKPHPQCMCYITVWVMDDDQFIKAFNAGRFNQYLNIAGQEPSLGENAWLRLAKFGGAAAGTVAISQGASAIGRMLDGKGISTYNNINFNPMKWKRATPTPAAALDEIADLQDEAYGELLENVDEVPGLTADDIPAWAIKSDLPKLEKLSKTEDIIEMVDDEAIKLEARQDAFAETALGFADPVRLEGLTGEQIRQYLPSFFDEEDMITRYRTMMGEAPGQMLNINTTGNALEEWGKAMYGRSSYRTMNARLRDLPDVTDLDAYDASYGPLSRQFWDEMSEGVGELASDGNNYKMLQLFERQGGFIRGDFDAVPDIHRGKFGYRMEDLRTYYDEAIDSAGSVAVDDSRWQKPELGFLSRMKSHSDVVRAIDGSMRPIPEDNMVFRISSPEWAGLSGRATLDDIGSVFQEKAFTSTEGVPEYFNDIGNNALDTNARGIRYMIHAPAGTMATRFNTFENEIGLARGTKFQIVDVIDLPAEAPFSQEVRLSVIDQVDTWTEAQGFMEGITQMARKEIDNILFQGSDDDMYDQIFGDLP